MKDKNWAGNSILDSYFLVFLLYSKLPRRADAVKFFVICLFMHLCYSLCLCFCSYIFLKAYAVRVFACTKRHPSMRSLVITNNNSVHLLCLYADGNLCSISALIAVLLSRFLVFAAGFWKHLINWSWKRAELFPKAFQTHYQQGKFLTVLLYQ